MKRSDLFYTAVLVPVDFAMLLLASIFVYFLRFSSTFAEIRPVQFLLPFDEYILLVLAVVPFWIAIFALSGLYNIKQQRRLVDDLYQVFLAVTAGITALIIFIFFRQELFNSRFLVIANWILAILLVTLGRWIVRRIRVFMFKYNYGVKRVVLIGSDEVCEGLLDAFKTDRFLGHKVISHIQEVNKDTIKQLKAILADGDVDTIMNCDPSLEKRRVVQLIELAEGNRIDYQYVPDFFETKAANVDVTTIADIPVVTLKRTPLDGWHKVIKRLFDIVLSFVAVVLLLPVYALIAIAVRIDSPGPVFYKNQRVGYKGKHFMAYKFRSMKIEYCTGDAYGGNDALKVEEDLIKKKSKRKGPIYKVLDDPRRTKVGKFLEKTSLDELPQFVNVLFGHMSLIGPRPHQPREVEKYDKHHKRIFEIKPGITGLAQISGRSDLDYEEEFHLDVYYMENWNLGMDLQILLKTPFVLLKRRNYT